MKKRLLLRTIISFLLTIHFCINISYGIFTPNIYQSDDKKIIAFAELNAATINLPSGSKVHATNINGDTQMNITTITTPVELLLVVDTSGSMSGDRIESTRNSIRSLVNNFFEHATSIKVDLFEFNSDASPLIKASDNKEDILHIVDSLSAGGGTNMLPALNLAEDRLNEIAESGDEVKPYLIILTDGATSNEDSCYNKLMEIYNKSIPIYNILVGMASNAAFSKNNVDAGYIYSNITAEQLQEIYDGIYQSICFDLINNDITDFIENANNYFVSNDNLYMFLDSELLQGCELELEYIINIKTAFPVTKLQLQSEVDSKLSFDPSSHMISEDTTNSDYGWEVNTELSNKGNHNLVLSLLEQSNSDDEPIIKSGKTYQSKVLFSCVLGNKDDTNFKHRLFFQLNGSSGQIIDLDSMEVNIVPPFGANHNYLPLIILMISLSLVYIIFYIFIRCNNYPPV